MNPCLIHAALTVGIAELGRRQRLKTLLTEEVFSTEGYKLPSSKSMSEEREKQGRARLASAIVTYPKNYSFSSMRCLTKILSGSVSSHITFLCVYSGILHFNTLMGVKNKTFKIPPDFELTCKCCTQSRRDGRSSPGPSPPRPPQIPCSCCRACHEASGSPGGTDSHRSS